MEERGLGEMADGVVLAGWYMPVILQPTTMSLLNSRSTSLYLGNVSHFNKDLLMNRLTWP